MLQGGLLGLSWVWSCSSTAAALLLLCRWSQAFCFVVQGNATACDRINIRSRSRRTWQVAGSALPEADRNFVQWHWHCQWWLRHNRRIRQVHVCSQNRCVCACDIAHVAWHHVHLTLASCQDLSYCTQNRTKAVTHLFLWLCYDMVSVPITVMWSICLALPWIIHDDMHHAHA